jgi:hypothetical protein
VNVFRCDILGFAKRLIDGLNREKFMSESSSIFGRLRTVLQNTYFFQSLKMSELDELIGHLRMIRVQKGYEVIKQGDPGDAFYLISSGKVSVWKKKTMGKSKVADLGRINFLEKWL